jgi:acyl-CoA thioesterase
VTPLFIRQTAVDADPGVLGRYRMTFTDEWNAPAVPQGGIAAAVAARAMTAELDVPDQHLRSLTTVFAAQVRSGPVEIDVTMLRRGRTMSQLSATMRSEGEVAGHTSVAVFGSARAGFEFTDVAMPDVPPPEECPSWRDPPPDGFEQRMMMTFWENIEGRAAIGHPPWEDYVPATSERANWFRFDEPPFVAGSSTDRAIDPLALVTLCDTMPGAVSERMGPDTPFWVPPSADLTVHLFGDATSEWLLAHNHARHAGNGYASVEMTLWDPMQGLVAYATQMMYLVFPDGPPSSDRRRPPV